MESIILEAVPNQIFTIPLGGNNYDLKIYSIDGHMAYDIGINGENVISGFKMVNDIPLLVYTSQEVSGNLLLQIPELEIPDYKRFGLSQFLHFFDADEIAEYRKVTNL